MPPAMLTLVATVEVYDLFECAFEIDDLVSSELLFLDESRYAISCTKDENDIVGCVCCSR